MRVGTIIKLNEYHLSNEEGARGICVQELREDEEIESKIIFENGEYGIITLEEQKSLITFLTISMELMNYKFTDIFQALNDFESGLFDEALGKEKEK